MIFMVINMIKKQTKTVRLILPLELYETIKTQADEDYRTVPKQIIQLLKAEFGFLGRS